MCPIEINNFCDEVAQINFIKRTLPKISINGIELDIIPSSKNFASIIEILTKHPRGVNVIFGEGLHWKIVEDEYIEKKTIIYNTGTVLTV